MQRARRLASTAVVAVLAVSGLSACRNAPDVAAYVGNTTISEDRVNAIFDDAKKKLAASVAQVGAEQSADPAAAPAQDPQLSIDKADVLMTLVGLDALRRIAEEKKIAPVALQAGQAAQEVNLPPDAEFVKVYGDYRAYLGAFAQSLGASLQSVQPTEADLRDVYTRLKNGGAIGAEGDTSFENFVKTLPEQDAQVLQQNIGLRNALNTEVQKINTTVNPRYGAAELPLVQFRNAQGTATPLILLTFDDAEASPAVTDRPAPAAPVQP
jgi:hypothetical protein